MPWLSSSQYCRYKENYFRMTNYCRRMKEKSNHHLTNNNEQKKERKREKAAIKRNFNGNNKKWDIIFLMNSLIWRLVVKENFESSPHSRVSQVSHRDVWRNTSSIRNKKWIFIWSHSFLISSWCFDIVFTQKPDLPKNETQWHKKIFLSRTVTYQMLLFKLWNKRVRLMGNQAKEYLTRKNANKCWVTWTLRSLNPHIVKDCLLIK